MHAKIAIGIIVLIIADCSIQVSTDISTFDYCFTTAIAIIAFSLCAYKGD